MTLKLGVSVSHLGVTRRIRHAIGQCHRSLVRHRLVAQLMAHFLSGLDHVPYSSFLVLPHEHAEVDVGLLFNDLVPSHEVEFDLVCCRYFDVAVFGIQFEQPFFRLVQLSRVSLQLLGRLGILVLLSRSETLNAPLDLPGFRIARNGVISIPFLRRAGVERHRAVLLRAYRVPLNLVLQRPQFFDSCLEHFLL